MTVTRRGLRIDRSRFESLSVKAGILENATYPATDIVDARTGDTFPDRRAGMKVATIAAALNYGHRQAHPRPFMQVAIANYKARWIDTVVSLMMRGVEPRKAVALTGQMMRDDIRRTIAAWPADNSEEWAEIKGFNHGLILTSHLMNSVESEIEQQT